MRDAKTVVNECSRIESVPCERDGIEDSGIDLIEVTDVAAAGVHKFYFLRRHRHTDTHK